MKINPNYKLEKIASTDPNRHILNHLHINKAHPVLKCPALEATDGRRYVAVPIKLEKGDNSEFIHPSLLQAARIAHRAMKKKLGKRNFNKYEMSIKLRKRWTQTEDRIIRPQADLPIDPYPKVSEVMPRLSENLNKTPIERSAINAQFLAEMQEAMNDGRRHTAGVKLTFYGELQPIEVEPTNVADMCYGVLMQMRI